MTAIRRHVRRGISATLAALAMLWPTLSQASSEQPQVGADARPLVLPFSVTVEAAVPGGDGAAFWLGEAAAILLADELDARGIPAMSRSDRVEAFARLQLPFAATLTLATMLRVAELVGATELVVGEVRLGSRLTVKARVIAVDAARQRQEIVEEGPGTDIYAIFERVAARLVPGTPRSDRRAHLPIGAFEQYVKGLVAPTAAAQERFLEQARLQAPANDRVLLALWDVYSSQDKHDKALAVAGAVSRQAPLDRQARFCMALSLVELQRYTDAFTLLQTLHGEAASPVLSNAMGVVQIRRGGTPQTGLASYFFTRAVDEDPEHSDYLFNLGYAYARSRDVNAALYWLREEVRFAPADGEAHLVMSHALLTAGRKVEAQREFDLAKQLGTSLDPGSLVLSEAVPAGLERLVGRLDLRTYVAVNAAIANPAQREQQELAEFHVGRGRRLFEQDDDRAAVGELRRAIYLLPYNDEPHLLLGRIYQRGGRLRDAVNEFRIAVWCRDTSIAHVRLGEALLDIGDRNGARQEVQRALALAPDSPEARALLARIGGSRP
ncbi:MAG: tetratricopeptide repeat protein [Vicinamibacterales bacterium]